MVCLFVYGTLTDDGLVATLIGRPLRKLAAVLPGYRKVTPEGGYSYIVPEANAAVHGFVLCDVDAEALHTFDAYEAEGQLYRRTEVIVTVTHTPLRAMTYVGIPEALAHS